MKLTIRIPTVDFGYQEVEFESVEEYQKEYPLYMKAFIDMQTTIKDLKQ